MVIWKPLIDECFQCKEEVIGHVQQKSPWLYSCFYPFPVALWTSLQLVNASTMEVNKNWKSLSNFQFYELDKAIKLAKKENKNDRRKVKQNCKTFSKVKCIKTSYRKCRL